MNEQSKFYVITALGLSLLATSGYAFRYLSAPQIYLSPIPLVRVVVPFFITFCGLTLATYFILRVYAHLTNDKGSQLVGSLIAAAALDLCLAAFLRMADFRLNELLDDTAQLNEQTAYMAIFPLLAVLAFIAGLNNQRLKNVLRFSTLAGVIVFLMLGYRLITTPAPFIEKSFAEIQSNEGVLIAEPRKPDRRVVWIIFDEFDPDYAFGQVSQKQLKLQNFSSLLASSVFAKNSYPPSSDTISSIPSMLTGVPTTGNAYRGDGKLFIQSQDGAHILFEQKNTIIQHLPAGPASFSILGFYHPYCRIFPLAKCKTFSLNAESSSIWKPNDRRQAMRKTTESQRLLLNQFVADISHQLTYVHLNIPHLEADYATSYFGFSHSSDPTEQYKRNLLLADEMLGEIMHQLNASKSADQPTLLIVSSDHGWRHRINTLQSEEKILGHRSLMIAKRIGENNALQINERISGVHIGNLALAFLKSELDTHQQISHWYRRQVFHLPHIEAIWKTLP
jgi:hypothetical protein